MDSKELKSKLESERKRFLEANFALDNARADFEVKLANQEKLCNMLEGSCQQLQQLISESEESEKKELEKQKKK